MYPTRPLTSGASPLTRYLADEEYTLAFVPEFGSRASSRSIPIPAVRHLPPHLNSCCQAIFGPVCFSVYSSTWGNPEVWGGDDFGFL